MSKHLAVSPKTRNSDSYVPPIIVQVGGARDVVKGVAVGGDDFFGYSDPEFEHKTAEDPDLRKTGRIID